MLLDSLSDHAKSIRIPYLAQESSQTAVQVLCVGAGATALAGTSYLTWKICKYYHSYLSNLYNLIIFDEPVPFADFPSISDHHKRRHATYPSSYMNAWYHLCDKEDLDKADGPLEFHMVGQVLALWKKSDGTPVCQSAYCPHLGNTAQKIK
jgi:hypothetical protein